MRRGQIAAVNLAVALRAILVKGSLQHRMRGDVLQRSAAVVAGNRSVTGMAPQA
jgi:hypothetical protein